MRPQLRRMALAITGSVGGEEGGERERGKREGGGRERERGGGGGGKERERERERERVHSIDWHSSSRCESC